MQKLEFTLKQHTPLIHFQHDQAGATLRATEVKPKLDRFLIETCKEHGIDFKKWLIGNGEHEALDYKLSFVPIGKNIQPTIISPKINPKNNKFEAPYPMVLANMGGAYNKEELRDLIQFESIKGRIIAFNQDIIDCILKYISKFFATENFGNRESKGFGSFTVTDYQIGTEEKKTITWDEKIVYPKDTFYLQIETSDVKKVFEVIDYYWKRLKSGINYSYNRKLEKCMASTNPELYQKAFLYKYLESPKISSFNWEKRKIKRDFFNKSIPPSPKDEKFARAFLGLPDKFTYAKTSEFCNPTKPKTYIKTRIELDIEHKEKDEFKKIDRIPSPIIFKPIQIDRHFNIYILFGEVDDSHSVTDKEFSLSIVDFPLKYDKDAKGKDMIKKVKAGTDISSIKDYVDKAHINGFGYLLPDLNYFLSLPTKIDIKTPMVKIDLKNLIKEYNLTELTMAFNPIDYNGIDICRNTIIINQIL